MQAMILAAGFGTRLQPYTDIRPKPLFPILNVPLLLLTIKRLQVSGCDHIIVNCHHLREQVVSLLDGMPGVFLQQEESIMGTGGGLRLAYGVMKDEPLLIINGDIYHTIDYCGLYKHHIGSGARVTLAVHDFPRFNCLNIQADKLVGFHAVNCEQIAAFTGVHVVEPDILEPISIRRKSCIIERYKSFLQSGHDIHVYRADDSFWTDIGTPRDYLELHGGLLRGEVPIILPDRQDKPITTFLVDGRAEVGRDLEMKDWVCIGEARIGDNVTICRSVVWSGAIIPNNSVITDCLITPLR